jgi:hypothetical protein
MASTPQFTTTPKIGIANISAANANRDGSGTIPTVFTAGSSGSRIEEVVVKAEDNPADSIIILWIYDGATAFIFDEIDLGDPGAASTTVTAFRLSRRYENLVLPTGYSLRATLTVAPTAGDVNVIGLGGDF